MSPRPVARVRTVKRAHVVLDLPDVDATLLGVLAKHTARSQSEVVSDALHLLFAAIPRPVDAKGGR